MTREDFIKQLRSNRYGTVGAEVKHIPTKTITQCDKHPTFAENEQEAIDALMVSVLEATGEVDLLEGEAEAIEEMQE